MIELERPEAPSTETPILRPVFPDGTLRASTVTPLVVVAGVLLAVLLATGVVMALLGLAAVQRDVAELKARGTGQAQARPTTPPPTLPKEPVSIDGAALRGSGAARVVIVEFSDFQCPFCARFASTTFLDLDKEYIATGKVLLAFRHLPIDELHPNARGAAIMAECAGRQNKFWEMHDRLFRDPGRLAPEELRASAKSLGLGGPAFDSCLNGGAAERIALDVAEAQRLQVHGTPGFLIGTLDTDRQVRVVERLAGAQPLSAFRVVLDRLLSSI